MNDTNINIKKDLDKVENILSDLLTGSVFEANVNEMCMRVVKSGGKRIRPRLALTSWYAAGKTDADEGILNFAASTEFLHTATLVHDDVIDKATVRRGVRTLNDTEGNHVAVLAGDYLFTRCFLCIQRIREEDIVSMFNSTLSALVTGEINQLSNEGNLNISVEDYLKTIYCKTGALFELATAGAAVLSKADDTVIKALSEYGKQLGIAFQVADDILDYTSSEEQLGKNIGEDLEDGRITLPLIFALCKSSESDRIELKEAINDADLKTVMHFIDKTNAIEMSRDFALDAVNKANYALSTLKHNEYVEELKTLAFNAANRSH